MNRPDPVGLYIIVADDDIDDHNLIREAVKECDRNNIVSSVYNGRQLMDLLLQKGFYKHDFENLPNLIVLDVKMPIMSGIDALREIKQDPTLKRIPVFVLTETDNREMAAEALELGAEDYFTKPLSYDDLKQLILGICGRVTTRTAH